MTMNGTHGRPGTAGEQAIQDQCGSTDRAERFYRTQVIDHLNERMKAFIQAADMLFIASASGGGDCDASFRAGPPGFVHVLGDRTITWPEYRGNGVGASLGNMRDHPRAGLFIPDFTRARIGLHVNGAATVLTPWQAEQLFPDIDTSAQDIPGRRAEFFVVLGVHEAYIHCRKHLPHLQPVPESEQAWGADDPDRKGGDYFGVAADATPQLERQPGG